MTDVVFEANTGKGFPEGLKGLQFSKLSRKNFFNFLAEINSEELYGKKDNTIYGETNPQESNPRETNPQESNPRETNPQEPIKLGTIVIDDTSKSNIIDNSSKKDSEEQVKEEIKCQACMKTFATDGSLKRHHARFTVCIDWINMSKHVQAPVLTRGIHLIIEELLELSIGNNDLECKYCKTNFTTKGNHHKHFNTSTVCNQLAYQEFKKLFSKL